MEATIRIKNFTRMCFISRTKHFIIIIFMFLFELIVLLFCEQDSLHILIILLSLSFFLHLLYLSLLCLFGMSIFLITAVHNLVLLHLVLKNPCCTTLSNLLQDRKVFHQIDHDLNYSKTISTRMTCYKQLEIEKKMK